MTVDIETTFTDYEWIESSRPVLAVDALGNSATVRVGANISAMQMPNIEITTNDPDEMVSMLEGYADIFLAAAQHLKALNS